METGTQGENFKTLWRAEEAFPLKGWDFSHINGRFCEQPLPWDYRDTVKKHMLPDTVMLDMGTGGGEFLLSLSPPTGRTFATEGYAPNIPVAQAALSAHGIELAEVSGETRLPFEDGFFSLVINRHESFFLPEVCRVLKSGGVFITQQVGEQNNRSISAFLLKEVYRSSQRYPLAAAVAEAKRLGFDITDTREAFPETRYFDVGAFVFMAKTIEWEFPGFSVDRCLQGLLELQEQIEKQGYIAATEHRYLLVARKE